MSWVTSDINLIISPDNDISPAAPSFADSMQITQYRHRDATLHAAMFDCCNINEYIQQAQRLTIERQNKIPKENHQCTADKQCN
jgi:hypothetical protein